MPRNRDNLGNRLGPRIAKIVTDAAAVHHVKTGPHRRRLFMQMQEDFFTLTGAEQKATLGELWAMIADHPDADPWLAKTFGFLARGHGQWQTLLANSVAGGALQIGLVGLINNAMAPVVTELIAQSPRGILDAPTLAAALARGYIPSHDAYWFAARNGLNQSMFEALELVAQTELPGAVVLDLLNRGDVTESDATLMLRRQGMQADRAAAFIKTKRQLLSPAVAADAVIRGLITQGEGEHIAGLSGMEAQDFDLLTLDTGESLAVMMLTEAYRRGIIDDARLAHGIRTGRTRNEWIDVVKALRYQPPSPADAIRAAVQNHLPESEAMAKAEQAGLDPAEFPWLLETAGEPIATGQAIELWRRGKIGQAEVEQVIRESRTKTKYVPAILELRRHILPERTVASMYGKGALTKAQATQRLSWVGVDQSDITALLSEYATTKVAGHRELSESTILALFADKAISEAACRKHLTALGYVTADIDLILRLVALVAQRKLQTAAINVIRGKYVSRHIDAAAAGTALDAAQVSSHERDQLLAMWALEREQTTRLPSVAELSAAVKAGVIDANTWAARLVELGYDAGDVPIMAAAHKITMGV